MKRFIAKLHLYLALFFAPFIVLFSVSGALQVFYFHKSLKGGSYQAPYIIQQMASLHTNQYLGIGSKGSDYLLFSFRLFTVALCIGLVVTAILGIVMAFQRTPKAKRWIPAGILALGILVPSALIFVRLLLI